MTKLNDLPPELLAAVADRLPLTLRGIVHRGALARASRRLHRATGRLVVATPVRVLRHRLRAIQAEVAYWQRLSAALHQESARVVDLGDPFHNCNGPWLRTYKKKVLEKLEEAGRPLNDISAAWDRVIAWINQRLLIAEQMTRLAQSIMEAPGSAPFFAFPTPWEGWWGHERRVTKADVLRMVHTKLIQCVVHVQVPSVIAA